MSTSARASLGPTIQNIVFTTDFSSCSDSALPYARAIAGLFGATVHVVHVVPAEPLFGEFGVVLPDEGLQERHRYGLARRQMDRLMLSDPFSGVMCSQVVQNGHIEEVIPRLVDDLHADLIVLGTHGRHGLKQLVLGSTAEYIFRTARCPVLTVGPNTQGGLAAGTLKTILFATDFSQASRRALSYALLLAHTTKAHLILLHSLTETEATIVSFAESIITQIQKDLVRLVAGDTSITHSACVEISKPADAILSKAAQSSAGLIVMGAHKKGAASSAHSPWAVAHRVVCQAPCAVLTVRG